MRYAPAWILAGVGILSGLGIGTTATSTLPPGEGTGDRDGPIGVYPPCQLSPQLPADPDFIETGNEDKDRPFFNDFSWRLFIALAWPADPTRRGMPDLCRPIGECARPLVWESWKSSSELYPTDPISSPPSPWNDYEGEVSARLPGRDGKPFTYPFPSLRQREAGRVLSEILKNIQEAAVPPMASPGPLVAQNKTFVRYEIKINKCSYNFMLSHKYYLKANLPTETDQWHAKISFPCGSIHIKAAWMVLPESESIRRRFYHIPAKVANWLDDGTLILEHRTMGLVGLHIVYKTPKRKDWIWSTFEHMDNLELTPGVCSASFTSKNPPLKYESPGPPPPACKIEPRRPLPTDCQPVEVTRKTCVNSVTKQVNAGYQNHPQLRNTVWRYYQLIGTQWPKAPGDGEFGKPHLPNDLANVTLESYVQDLSCMDCHGLAVRSQMVYYPEVRAFTPRSPPKSP